MRLVERLLSFGILLATLAGIAAWALSYRPGSVGDGLRGGLSFATAGLTRPWVVVAFALALALGLAAAVVRRLDRGGALVAVAPAAAGAPRATQSLKQRLLSLAVHLKQHAGPTPDLISLVDAVVYGGLGLGASDVHLQPTGTSTQILFRLHGLLEPVLELEPALHKPLVNRLKVMTNLVSYVSDRPQDGKFVALGPRGSADVRVSILPTNHGEKVVLRLAEGAATMPSLAAIGISEAAALRLQRALERPQGLIYVTGPTGCGKTRTIYAALGQIKARRGAGVNIATIEDPIESDLPFLTQTQVRGEVGLGFAAGLRSLLRQDPNVLLVGEIRDPETARTAVQAGLSGHLILTTVHAESAAGVFNRLIDMPIEPFLVASASLASIAQRLVRALCPACRTAGEPTVDEHARLAQLGVRDVGRVYLPVGCPRCDGQGYAGRRPLVEVLEVTPAVRDLIIAKVPTGRIHEAAVGEGMRPLLIDGLEQVAAGHTTLSEVLRVVG